MPALPRPTKKRKNTRNSQPGTSASGPGVNTMMPVASEIMTADQMNTVRRPILSPSQPQTKAPGRRAETGSQQDRAALPVGQRPFLGQRRGDVADQEEIEEIEQIGDVGGADQLPLIADVSLLLLLQALDHVLLPLPVRDGARYGRIQGGMAASVPWNPPRCPPSRRRARIEVFLILGGGFPARGCAIRPRCVASIAVRRAALSKPAETESAHK